MPAFPIGPYELTIKRDRRDGELRIALRDADYSAVARLTICRPRASVGAGSAVELRPARSKMVASPSGPLPYVTKRFLSGAPFSTIAANSSS